MIVIKIIIINLLTCSLLISASISSFTSDRVSILKNESVNLTLNYFLQNPSKHYKIEYTVKDPNGNNFANSFVATSLTNAIWTAKSTTGFYTINAKVYEMGIDTVSKNLIIEVESNYCDDEYRLGGGDDSYYSVDMLHQFKFNGVSYTKLFAGTNGYITLDKGYSSFGSSIQGITHGIFPNTNKDLMTNIYVVKCTNKTIIRWDGGYYPNWNGIWEYTLTLFKNNTIQPSSVIKR